MIYDTVYQYYLNSIEDMNFILVPELSHPNDYYYKVTEKYGKGSMRFIVCEKKFLIIIADYTPYIDFEKTSIINENYLEMCQFSTASSSFKLGKTKTRKVNTGIFSYINNSKKIIVYCKKDQPVKFTKIIVTEDYYKHYLTNSFSTEVNEVKKIIKYLAMSPNIPELSFAFQQIESCSAVGKFLFIYLEGKVMEVLGLAAASYNKTLASTQNVKLNKKDINALKRVIKYLKDNYAAYPSISNLAKVANMSETRFQLAFKQQYKTTLYEYFKNLRMNYALQLLNETNYSIKEIALKVGYRNSGHFAGIFKKRYGITPKRYRDTQQRLV